MILYILAVTEKTRYGQRLAITGYLRIDVSDFYRIFSFQHLNLRKR